MHNLLFLFLFATFFFLTSAHAAGLGNKVTAECKSAFSRIAVDPDVFYKRRFLQLKKGLKKTHGTLILRGGVDAGFSAQYKYESRNIHLRQGGNATEKFILTHHETVHANTDHVLLTDPGSEDTTFAIKVSSESDPIHPLLPVEYSHDFRVDEMKAYRKIALLFQQAVRMIKALPEKSDAVHERMWLYEKNAHEDAKDSQKFARATLSVLNHVEEAIKEALKGKTDLDLNGWIYDEKSPHLYIIAIMVPRPNLSDLFLEIPLFDPSANEGSIENIYPKLLKVIDSARRKFTPYAQVYGFPAGAGIFSPFQVVSP